MAQVWDVDQGGTGLKAPGPVGNVLTSKDGVIWESKPLPLISGPAGAKGDKGDTGSAGAAGGESDPTLRVMYLQPQDATGQIQYAVVGLNNPLIQGTQSGTFVTNGRAALRVSTYAQADSSGNSIARISEGNNSGYNTQRALDPTIVMVVTPGTVSNCRVFAGLSSERFFQGESSLPSKEALIFRLDAATESTWKCISLHGSTNTVVDSGVTASTASATVLKIVCTSGNAAFYINGTNVANITTNLPTAPANIGYCVQLQTMNSTVMDLDVHKIWIQTK